MHFRHHAISNPDSTFATVLLLAPLFLSTDPNLIYLLTYQTGLESAPSSPLSTPPQPLNLNHNHNHNHNVHSTLAYPVLASPHPPLPPLSDLPTSLHSSYSPPIKSCCNKIKHNTRLLDLNPLGRATKYIQPLTQSAETETWIPSPIENEVWEEDTGEKEDEGEGVFELITSLYIWQAPDLADSDAYTGSDNAN
ncbi:hypothetical protein GJ744_011834 [Endocarpon pusillum]|uniref:Uncharacterized protein n=1 Tax=Endocarpon pusillum TaxID=364733 RepID=A0A8H7E342_9EURO|nr:hypothetical protein GJ744_011834 [Endocarpon pusillum]